MNKIIIIIFLSGIVATVTAQTGPSAEQVRQDRARGIVLPESDGHYQIVKGYVEDEPDADYIHASEVAHEAFRDIKFSIRIHWGVYSKWGIEASWPLLNMSNEKKTEYNELYKTFNPEGFDAEEWMSFFKRCGMQAFAFTTKHHDGFSMFHTKTRVRQRANYLDPEHPIEACDLAYSIEESPFKRDIVKELCDAAHRNNIKINLYFSHPDWYDADFRPYSSHPLTIDAARTTSDFGEASYDAKKIMTPNLTQEEKDRMVARHREQLSELLTNYGKIDMVCLDMWLGRYVWNETRETVKMMRRLQPDVMIRNRGIGNYGDYYQPEEFVPQGKENTNMPWMSICLLGKIFAYDPVAEHYKGTQWVVNHLIDCVAKGGSFMVCIGPDANGKFHPEAVRQLERVGEWLKINGEGIYNTHAREVWKSGDIRFTQSKDNKRIYAFVEKFSGKELIIPSVTLKKKSKVKLLGYSNPLKWQPTSDGGIKIEIPEALQTPENRPCEYAWAFRIEN
ncbi:MAG: alpha-L-fucosidase [Prevotellaceae bacterium]|jgi:alpha-L-fucosidase|nr:alpha-L-fucosidase [Prevotellaceae bacterium]